MNQLPNIYQRWCFGNSYCFVLFFFFFFLGLGCVITQDVTDLKSQYKDLLVRFLVFRTDWDLTAE